MSRLLPFALGLTLVGSATGCNPYDQFLADGPNLRGITIPLPPPSFADEVLISVDLQGTVPMGFEGPGTQAFVYEQGTARGYFTFTDTNEWTVYDVLVDLDDNCLDTWVVDGDGEVSTQTSYKAVLLEGEVCVSDTSCSAPDDLGACVCLEQWTGGC